MSTLYLDNTLAEENSSWTVTKRTDAGVGTNFITDYGQGILAYNTILDMYLGMYTMPATKLEYIPTKEVTAKAVVHEKSNTLIWLIPRNASGTLLATLKYDAYSKKPNLQYLWDEHTITLEQYREKNFDYESMTHVVVLQSPENRFSRFVNSLICTDKMKEYLKNSAPRNKVESLEEIQAMTFHMLALAELNALSGSTACDENLWPQYRYLELIPRVDVVVPLTLLDYYLQEEMQVIPVHEAMEKEVRYWLGKVNHESIYTRLEAIYGKDTKLFRKHRAKLYQHKQPDTDKTSD